MTTVSTLKALRDELSAESERLSRSVDALDAALAELAEAAAVPAAEAPKRKRRTKPEMELAAEVEAAGGPKASDTSAEAEAARADYVAAERQQAARDDGTATGTPERQQAARDDGTPERQQAATGAEARDDVQAAVTRDAAKAARDPALDGAAHTTTGLDLPGEPLGAEKAPEAPEAPGAPTPAEKAPEAPTPAEAEALQGRARKAAETLRDGLARGPEAKSMIAAVSEHPAGKLSGVPASELRDLVARLETAAGIEADEGDDF